MQSEFTASQSALYTTFKKNLKQKFDQTKIFKLNKYIIKVTYIFSSNRIRQKSQKVVHEERFLKNRTFKN